MQDAPDPSSQDPRPPDAPPDAPRAELRGLRFLRVLVTLLTAVMIVGMAAMVWLFATRLPDLSAPPATAPAPALPGIPDTLELPPGTTVQAVTAGPGWWLVVTAEGGLLLFDGTGALLRRIEAQELARP